MQRLLLIAAGLVMGGCVSALESDSSAGAPVAPIQDNSFLVEEAYNQEPGVVQHISTFERDWESNVWAYGFTQEWPLLAQRHQLSYTIPFGSFVDDESPGFGDVALNYRFEIPNADRSLVAAPRVSLVLPTGSVERGRGQGATGIELALPLSRIIAPQLVAHFNAVAAFTPSARNEAGDRAATRALGFGQSFIWLPRPHVNLMLETVWSRDESVAGPGERARATSFFVSPGVRWAWNFASGLQVVPGIAFPVGVGPSAGDRSFFLYLSFEHSFGSSAPARSARVAPALVPGARLAARR